MTLLHEAVDEKKLDVRLIERNLNRGSVTPAEVQKSIEALPDDEDNAEYVSVEELMSELGNDSDDDTSTQH
jgi:hypothetical protein